MFLSINVLEEVRWMLKILRLIFSAIQLLKE